MIIDLKENERLDDLQIKGYKIIQKIDEFCFGMDAVLLSGFTHVKNGERVIDIGTGTGIIPILLAAKTKAKQIIGIEIQQHMAEMAERSIRFNQLESRVEIINEDLKEAGHIFGLASFDVITSNPPYMNDSHGLKNPKESKAIARHEVLCNFDDIAGAASSLLKSKGRFYLIHRPHRLIEIIQVLSKYRLEPKRIRMVHPYLNKPANMVLIECLKDGGSMVKIEAPLIVYKEAGVYTGEVYQLYGYE